MPRPVSNPALVLGALTVLAGAPLPALAQNGDMTVREFLAVAEDIPEGPQALLRSDTRRLIGVFQSAGRTVRQEQVAALAGNRPSPTCMPERARLGREEIMERLRSVPAARRNITVTQMLREWMAERYPCT